VSGGYTILDLGELEAFPYHQRGGQKVLPIERTLDYRAAGINGWTGDPGEPLVPEHMEDSGEEELYVVVRGRASFTVDGQHIDAPAGTLIHVLSGETRAAVSEEAGTIIVVIGGTIGEARDPNGWTSFVVADALRREGRIDEARAAIREPIELFPDAWHAPYNAACFEALAGDADAAFAYLQDALRVDTQAVRKFAATDDDLDSLHDDPRWKKVAG
jgi:quercetin dioxygenase-like cupin family protein